MYIICLILTLMVNIPDGYVDTFNDHNASDKLADFTIASCS